MKTASGLRTGIAAPVGSQSTTPADKPTVSHGAYRPGNIPVSVSPGSFTENTGTIHPLTIDRLKKLSPYASDEPLQTVAGIPMRIPPGRPDRSSPFPGSHTLRNTIPQAVPLTPSAKPKPGHTLQAGFAYRP